MSLAGVEYIMLQLLVYVEQYWKQKLYEYACSYKEKQWKKGDMHVTCIVLHFQMFTSVYRHKQPFNITKKYETHIVLLSLHVCEQKMKYCET